MIAEKVTDCESERERVRKEREKTRESKRNRKRAIVIKYLVTINSKMKVEEQDDFLLMLWTYELKSNDENSSQQKRKLLRASNFLRLLTHSLLLLKIFKEFVVLTCFDNTFILLIKVTNVSWDKTELGQPKLLLFFKILNSGLKRKKHLNGQPFWLALISNG